MGLTMNTGLAREVSADDEAWLLEHVYYDESSPTSLRFKNMFHRNKENSVAFREVTKDGYFRGQRGSRGRRFFAHRVVWFLHYGVWPEKIDHIDGDRQNNAVKNLQETDAMRNQQNRDCNDIAGGYFEKRVGRWHCRIKRKGKVTFIGYFDTPEECRAAYAKAKLEIHENLCERSFNEGELKNVAMGRVKRS